MNSALEVGALAVVEAMGAWKNGWERSIAIASSVWAKESGLGESGLMSHVLDCYLIIKH